MLEARLMALREANKYNIHTDRHLIGLPRLIPSNGEELAVEVPFAVFQTDQEGETRLFAAGLYRDRLEPAGRGLKIRDKLVLLDTFAIPTLLATPLSANVAWSYGQILRFARRPHQLVRNAVATASHNSQQPTPQLKGLWQPRGA